MACSFRAALVLLLLSMNSGLAWAGDQRRSAILLGAGAGLAVPSTAFGPLSPRYEVGFNSSLWSSFALGQALGVRPSMHVYELGESYGSSRGARVDLSLALELVLAVGKIELVPALVASAVLPGLLRPEIRAVALGLSLGAQGLIYGRLGLYARSTHRLVVTIAEELLVHQFELGPTLQF